MYYVQMKFACVPVPLIPETMQMFSKPHFIMKTLCLPAFDIGG